MSPQLFSVYTEQVMREAEIDSLGISVNGKNITDLRYADDTALLAESYGDMQEVINRVNDAGKEAGLMLNAKKTKVMHVGIPSDRVFYVDQEPLENVDDMLYLGSYKSADTTCTKDVKVRTATAKKRVKDLENIWKDKSIPTDLKVKLLRALIWPVIMYGSEGWTLRTNDEKKIETTEMWCYRRALRISWTEKRTNSSILEELQKDYELKYLVRKRKMKYFGHAMRHKHCDLMKLVAQGKLEGKRRQGRPSMSYIDSLSKWTGLGKAAVIKSTEDRAVWRRLTVQSSAANIHDDAAR